LDFPIKEVILVQIILEVFLLVLLVLVLFRTGRKDSKSEPASIPTELQSTISRFITESEKISQSFSQNLEDKKNLSADLILKLDKRLGTYRELLKDTEASMARAITKLSEANQEGLRLSTLQSGGDGKANPAAPEVRALVLKLAKEGHSVEEIAEQAHLHRGEVELIIDLENQFNI
jgi:plasmid maintenance system antidote protein VapI